MQEKKQEKNNFQFQNSLNYSKLAALHKRNLELKQEESHVARDEGSRQFSS